MDTGSVSVKKNFWFAEPLRCIHINSISSNKILYSRTYRCIFFYKVKVKSAGSVFATNTHDMLNNTHYKPVHNDLWGATYLSQIMALKCILL